MAEVTGMVVVAGLTVPMAGSSESYLLLSYTGFSRVGVKLGLPVVVVFLTAERVATEGGFPGWVVRSPAEVRLNSQVRLCLEVRLGCTRADGVLVPLVLAS